MPSLPWDIVGLVTIMYLALAALLWLTVLRRQPPVVSAAVVTAVYRGLRQHHNPAKRD